MHCVYCRATLAGRPLLGAVTYLPGLYVKSVILEDINDAGNEQRQVGQYVIEIILHRE